MKRHDVFLPFALLLLLWPASASVETRSPPNPAAAQHDVLDVRHLTLGDGRVATSPKSSYVFSCQSDFSRGFGANGATPWIHGKTGT